MSESASHSLRVARIPEAAERVLTRESGESLADTLDIIPPLTVKPGERFDVTVVALHNAHVPATGCDWTVEVTCPDAGLSPVQVTFESGRAAVRRIENVVLEQEGVFRLQAEVAGEVVFSSPVVCRESLPFRVYWGDPHVHTILGDCHWEHCRSLDFAFYAGRYASGLDWMSCADHVSNGRCDHLRFEVQKRTSNNHDAPGEFVALPAYEASLKGGCGGDNNIYMRSWPERFVDHYAEGNIGTLLEELSTLLPVGDFVGIPHHTTRTGKHGEIPHAIYPGPDRMPAVEIASLWGASEFRGNPNPLRKIHDGPCYVRDLLGQGLPLGFVGGTDSHTSMPFRLDGRPERPLWAEPGGTAVLSQDLTRDGVFDAIRERRTYAGIKKRSFLNVTLNDARPGSVIAGVGLSSPRVLCIEAAGPSEIEALQIIRNGEVAQEWTGLPWHWSGSWTDEGSLEGQALSSPFLPGPFAYYYVRVVYAEGVKAWSSPVWVCR